MEKNLKDSQYFVSLPEIVKESIMQSGLQFKTEDEIREFVDSYHKTTGK